MATEYPPLGKFFVVSYANNDRDFPVVAVTRDPRNENYKIPEDLSPCPDKRYPNHVFTGAQPSSSDERVRLIYEILPAPWVPFTRYDDDLGPIQGRRRSVKNEGQKANLTSSTKTSYEGREGSAIVLNEIEETWSIAIDEDGNSLFPIKTRDLYDDRLGAIKETRQLIVYTGDEVASFEYNDPTITQTTYEPYNQYLSYKITTSYDLSGPVRREDIYDPIRGAVERTNQVIYDSGDLTGSIQYSNGAITQISYNPINTLVVDKVVEKYSVNGPIRREENYDPLKGPIQRISQIVYDSGNLVGSIENLNGIITQTIYQPVNTLVVDKIIETYSVDGPQLVGKITNESGQLVTVTTQRKASDNYVAPDPTAIKTVEASREDAESIVERVVDSPSVFDQKQMSIEVSEVIPEQFIAHAPRTTLVYTAEGSDADPELDAYELESSQTRLTEQKIRISKTSRDTSDLPSLDGQEYDPSSNISIPFVESISGGGVGDDYTVVDPLSSSYNLVRKYDIESIGQQLESVLLSFPTRSNLSLPSVLKGVTVKWDKSEESGNFSGAGGGQSQGDSYSLMASVDGDATATIQISPSFILDIEEIPSNNIPTNSYFFYLKYPVTIEDILSKIGGGVKVWPMFRPKSYTLSVLGTKKSVTIKGSARAEVGGGKYSASSSSSSGNGTNTSVSLDTKVLTIPPTLHGLITINEIGTSDAKAEANFYIAVALNGGTALAVGGTPAKITIEKQILTTIPKTSPYTDIPRTGKYLIDSRVELYQYGYAKVYAEVLDASIFKSN